MCVVGGRGDERDCDLGVRKREGGKGGREGKERRVGKTMVGGDDEKGIDTGTESQRESGEGMCVHSSSFRFSKYVFYTQNQESKNLLD